MRKLFVGGILLLVMGGCATQPTPIATGISTDANAQQGIALLSVTLDDGGLDQFDQFGLQLQAVGSSEMLEVPVKRPGMRNLLPDIVAEGQVRGRVVALALPAGTYRLKGWRAFRSHRPMGMYVFPRKDDQPDGVVGSSFSVTEGRSRYVGNIDIQMRRFRQVAATLNDQAARDLGLAHPRWGIKPAEVDVVMAR